jgi:hypothetical protein
MDRIAEFDENGFYEGPERRHCPVANCSSVAKLAIKNKTLASRITWVGGSFLTVLAIVSTIMLFMSKATMEIAKDANKELATFVKTHNQTLIDNQKVQTKLVTQMEEQQRQMSVVSKIQRDVVSEVAILKHEDKRRDKKERKP